MGKINTNTAKRLLTGFKETMKANSAIQKGATNLYRFNKNIKQVADITAKGGAERIAKHAEGVFHDLRAMDSDFNKAMSKISKKDLNHATEVQKYYNSNKASIDKHISGYKDLTKDIGSQKGALDKFKTYRDTLHGDTFGGNVKAGLDVAGNYFFGEGLKKGAIRTGTAAAGYMGLNMAGRSLTGGSLTRNGNSDSDIAGIPFI